MNKRQLKILYIWLILMLAASSALLFIINWDKDGEFNYVNELRIYSNESYQKIQNDLDLSGDEYIDALKAAENEGVYTTIIDLSANVRYSNSPYSATQSANVLDEALYMDGSYIAKNENVYKVALPLYMQGNVQGFAIYEKAFEMQKTLMIGKIILIAILILSIVFIVYFLGRMIYAPYPNELEALEKGLVNMTKGIYTKLSMDENRSYVHLYSSYNILCEELEYLIYQQQYNEAQRKIFINKISHELKTPISTIKAYIEGLKNNVAKDDEKREKYINIIHDKMNQLTNIINDLFVFTQEDANQLKYNFEECYADDIVDAIFNDIISQNDSITTCENLLPKCIINADRNRLEQVVLNLYNNAKKHTDENDTINLRAYRQDDDVTIEVVDSGEGIPAKELPYIFDSYYQGVKSKKADYQGVGLGLTICKSIVEAHGGSIKARSNQGEGTSMYVYIPIV